MRVLQARFEGLREGVDGYSVTWNTVARRPLTDTEQQVGNALAILDTSEAKTEEVGYMRVDLTVLTEFWLKMLEGDVASERLNDALADVQRAMRSDIKTLEDPSDPLTQLTINVTEVRNEFDVDGPGDRLVGGVAQWSVLYRHSPLDPTRCQ